SCCILYFHSVIPLLYFFNDPPTIALYTLSLHDALPIWTFASASDSPTISATTLTPWWSRLDCRRINGTIGTSPSGLSSIGPLCFHTVDAVSSVPSRTSAA